MTSTQPAHAESGTALGGVLLMLVAASVRMLSMHEPFPGWSGDPFSTPEPIVGLTPTGSLAVDAALAVGAALAAWGAIRSGHSRGAWWGLALLPFAGVAAWHARVESPNAVENVVQGGAWVSALAAGWAVSLAGHDARCKRVLVAGLLGLVGLLAAKGAMQVWIEHPATVVAFTADKEAFLASHGWTADSPMARAYERRLMQAEGSGWFGMANVYAGVMAAMATAMVGLLLSRVWRREPYGAEATAKAVGAGWVSWVLLAGVLLALAGVYLAGAKGGYAVFALGLGLVAMNRLTIRSRSVPSAIGWALRRASVQRVLGRVIGFGAVAGVLCLVWLRGEVGTRLSELSVLFRWFYISTAGRVFWSSPWTGVGPGNFKDSYAVMKPAISPEDVSSPHSVLFDWASMMGVAGLIAGGLWWCWVIRAGRGVLEAPGPTTFAASPLRREVLWVGAALAIAVALAVRLEAAIATPEAAIMRLAGLVAGVVIVLGVLAAMRDATPRAVWGACAAMAAAAVALAANMQIELTGTHIGSVAWVMLVIGLAGSCVRRGEASTPEVKPHSGAAFMAAIPIIAVAAVVASGVRVFAWERNLREAGDAAWAVGSIEAQLRDAGRLPEVALSIPMGATFQSERDQAFAAIAIELREALRADGLAVPARLQFGEIGPAILLLRESRTTRAAVLLEDAMQSQPSHFGTLAALTRVELARAEIERFRGKSLEADERIRLAVELSESFAAKYPSSAAWGWAGTLADGVSRTAPKEQAAAYQRRAIAAWEAAAERSPYGVVYPVAIARGYAAIGQPVPARQWAKKALERDRLTFLDPLAGLSGETRRDMQLLADPQE